jgi:small-conductance mechanosensitive channel
MDAANTILAVAAVITALAGFVKAWQSGVNVKELEARIEAQAKRIDELVKENITLKGRLDESEKENRALREQNDILAGVNKEYRERLLPEIRRK